MRVFENLNVNFMAKRKFFYFLSATLLFLGIISIIFRGLQFGIDFKGGTEVAIQFEKPIQISDVRKEVDKIGLGNVEVKTFGGSTGILLRTEIQEIPANIFPKVTQKIRELIEKSKPGTKVTVTDSTINSITFSFPDPETANFMNNKLFEAGFQTTKASEEATNTAVIVRVGIADWIKENLSERFHDNPFNVLKEDKVGPKIGQELKTDALLAVLISLIVILIYLGFRFKFTFAIGAVAALFHDVLITLGLFSILYGVFPGLNLEISISVVAAFLTLVGYSINDTVVVFDRVRENLKIHKTLPLEENMNNAINKTMSRTIITGFTTLISVIVLLIFGGEVLKGFAFALFIGIITGTYSSIFVASAFVLEYANRTNKKVQF
ncbi:protein translocase subunit SecF [Melioribacteraceae bacterium 4301-Me]|uniref:protein translocase subunit SecF n=1 Tax=Pyranulibacter aquaticus TaxID=3163344 RepID=UPI00359AD1EE